ncbi:MAG: thiamine diphosphokinase [Actinobacteria bacterium]|nr:thiamine diphosphokinase [Actinomycetota bacterium]
MTKHESLVVVVGGGEPPATEVARWLVAEIESQAGNSNPPAVVVAVDHGLDHVRDMGLVADVVVGDMDSVSTNVLKEATEAGVKVARFLADKNESDLELALAWVNEHIAAPRRVVCVGTAGGRWDHEIINVAVIGAWAAVHDDVTIVERRGTIRIVVGGSGPVVLETPVGTTISLHPLGGDATGVNVTGMTWPLEDAVLTPGSSLALSNVSEGERQTVSCLTGRLLAVVAN